MTDPDAAEETASLVEKLIRFTIVIAVLVISIQIISPFTGVAGLALILAVAIYPLYQKLAARCGGRQGLAATIFVISGLILIGAPTMMLGSSLATQASTIYQNLENGTLEIAQPNASIQELPIVGERLYAGWSRAADDAKGFVEQNRKQVLELAHWGLDATAKSAASLLAFLASIIITGIMMAYAEPGSNAIGRIFRRVCGEHRGIKLQNLATATIRSVASGVVGVSFIQALLLGFGFILADIPAPGVIALAALVLGIVQVPAIVVSGPVIAYMWWASGDGNTAVTIVLTVYFVIATLTDNILKPIFLGRGVEAPMPVILLGAIGGLMSFGLIGVFTGPVVLAITYVVFMEWINNASDQANDPTANPLLPDK